MADGDLKEGELEGALIGFEEASGKKVYLFHFEQNEGDFTAAAVITRLTALSVPAPSVRKLAGDQSNPMTAVYSTLSEGKLRIKWSERQKRV